MAVHKSHLNREDKRDTVAARIEGEKGTKVGHIFEDGSGTSKKGEEPL